MFEAPAGRLSLDQIQICIDRLAQKIEAPPQTLPTYGYTEDFARPHIESDRAYHFVVVERGQEVDRRTTQELDQLLYWVFSGVTFSIACDFERANRVAEADFRRMLFQKQLELLGRLDPHWRERCESEISGILSKYPLSDA